MSISSELRLNLAEPGRFDAVTALGTSSRVPSEERLRQMSVPTLVLMGSKDPDFPDPAVEGKELADLTGGKLEMIDGAGHYPQSEMPEATAQVVIAFLIRV
jgi:pimeloyl-ACP methyl ester carboxylesterase